MSIQLIDIRDGNEDNDFDPVSDSRHNCTKSKVAAPPTPTT